MVNRWAVSTVMTRQNLIPRQDDCSKKTYGLIPLWDMCNHANGVVGSVFGKKWLFVYFVHLFFQSHKNNKVVPVVEFMYLEFTCMKCRVTLGDSGLCCCAPCPSSAIISHCSLKKKQGKVRSSFTIFFFIRVALNQ